MPPQRLALNLLPWGADCVSVVAAQIGQRLDAFLLMPARFGNAFVPSGTCILFSGSNGGSCVGASGQLSLT